MKDINDKKLCKSCNEIKNINEFHLQIGTKDDHRTMCKDCLYKYRHVIKLKGALNRIRKKKNILSKK